VISNKFCYSFKLIQDKYKNLPLGMGLTNNDIFKKLRVAHKLRDDQIVKICDLVDYKITKSELGAFFRNERHEKYMECGDQVLRNFLNGLIIYLRGPLEKK
jgi:uncharacterized protein YehS (DUF1456 family)